MYGLIVSEILAMKKKGQIIGWKIAYEPVYLYKFSNFEKPNCRDI